MAWATATPLNFGQYFPGGDLVGWDEQISQYADSFPKEKRKYIHPALIAKKFTKNQDLVRAEESPRLFRINKKPKALASMFFLTDGLLVVDPALFQIIEKYEPNVHQFFPIQIELPKGEFSPVQYQLIVIRNFADAFIMDASLGLLNSSGELFGLYDLTKKFISNKNQIF